MGLRRPMGQREVVLFVLRHGMARSRLLMNIQVCVCECVCVSGCVCVCNWCMFCAEIGLTHGPWMDIVD